MRKISIAVVALLCVYPSFAQKKPLTIESVKNWPDIRNEAISSDGRVLMYKIYKGLPDDTLVVQSVDQRWTEKFSGITLPVFTANSQWFLYKKRDSLFIYDIKKYRLVTALGDIASFKVPSAGSGVWLACLTKSADKKLVLHNLKNNNTITYDSVSQFQFADNGKVLLLQRAGNVQWIDLKEAKTYTVMQHISNARSFAFDEAGEQLAFLADEMKNGSKTVTLRYYKKGMDSATVKVNDNTPEIDSRHWVPAPGIKFSPDGRRILFPLRKVIDRSRKAAPGTAEVNIWHYDDEYLQTEQTVNLALDSNRIFMAVINIGDNTIFQINQGGDEPFIDLAGDGNADFAIVRQNGNYFAGKWKASTVPVFYSVDLKNGQRNKIIAQRDLTVDISPAGKYIIWYDPLKKTFFTYDTRTQQVRDITPTLAGTLTPTQSMRLNSFTPFGIAGWLPNDQALLLYDEFDIWKIDLAGEKAPLNITNGYGRRNHIVLRVWNTDNSDYSTPVINNKTLLLSAFDVENMNNGFFKGSLFATAADPVKLSLDPYLYYGHYRFNCQFLAKFPITKARHADAYLVRRMDSKEYPNLYFTRDFKQFIPVSNVQPQQDYNWLTTELISWKQTDGTTSKGILYKPANFDPNKKYPIIFYFYERLSYRLHQFLEPELSRGSLNIPFFVSNGYLVCTPDISYITGNPGESAYQSVGSAARYLSQMPWVDSERMGLQGHSFGGYQVNYIVSRTNLFAAAQESAGASDFISYYNGFYREHSAQFYFEYGQGRLGYTLWEKPDLYFQNSPIFKADQVQTPLLIMHNKEDGEVPFQQGIEWFTALRRLGKKVWMLQYDKEHHGIDQPKNQRDFTIRVAQFFDHYLKGSPAPKWMVNGVPASVKGMETGLELIPGSSTAAGK
jgi:dienelactone hydrolase